MTTFMESLINTCQDLYHRYDREEEETTFLPARSCTMTCSKGKPPLSGVRGGGGKGPLRPLRKKKEKITKSSKPLRKRKKIERRKNL